MNRPDMVSRQGHRLVQTGVALFLFTSLEGFVIQQFRAPALGRSLHSLSGFSGVLLIALGLVWPRLTLGSTASRIAFWSLLYSSFAIMAAFLLGAVWGAGSETMPIAAAGLHGSAIHETVIKVVAYSSAPGLISFALILWGVRIDGRP